MKIIALLIALLIVGCSRYATIDQEAHGDQVAKAVIVSFLPIGPGGLYTGDYRQVWQISRDEDAERRFVEMIERENIADALYGLMGLKIINSEAFSLHAQNLSSRPEEVRYGRGCIIMNRSAQAVIQSIDQADLPEPRW